MQCFYLVKSIVIGFVAAVRVKLYNTSLTVGFCCSFILNAASVLRIQCKKDRVPQMCSLVSDRAQLQSAVWGWASPERDLYTERELNSNISVFLSCSCGTLTCVLSFEPTLFQPLWSFSDKLPVGSPNKWKQKQPEVVVFGLTAYPPIHAQLRTFSGLGRGKLVLVCPTYSTHRCDASPSRRRLRACVAAPPRTGCQRTFKWPHGLEPFASQRVNITVTVIFTTEAASDLAVGVVRFSPNLHFKRQVCSQSQTWATRTTFCRKLEPGLKISVGLWIWTKRRAARLGSPTRTSAEISP